MNNETITAEFLAGARSGALPFSFSAHKGFLEDALKIKASIEFSNDRLITFDQISLISGDPYVRGEFYGKTMREELIRYIKNWGKNEA